MNCWTRIWLATPFRGLVIFSKRLSIALGERRHHGSFRCWMPFELWANLRAHLRLKIQFRTNILHNLTLFFTNLVSCFIMDQSVCDRLILRLLAYPWCTDSHRTMPSQLVWFTSTLITNQATTRRLPFVDVEMSIASKTAGIRRLSRKLVANCEVNHSHGIQMGHVLST